MNGRTALALLLIGFITFVVGYTVGTTSQSPEPAPIFDVFDADNFPCTEDDVLGYDPAFLPGMVGCIHAEGNTLERP
jgi:hypothetical protein